MYFVYFGKETRKWSSLKISLLIKSVLCEPIYLSTSSINVLQNFKRQKERRKLINLVVNLLRFLKQCLKNILDKMLNMLLYLWDIVWILVYVKHSMAITFLLLCRWQRMIWTWRIVLWDPLGQVDGYIDKYHARHTMHL